MSKRIKVSKKASSKPLDPQLDETLDLFADLIIDSFLAMTPEQREKFRKECEREKLSQVKK